MHVDNTVTPAPISLAEHRARKEAAKTERELVNVRRGIHPGLLPAKSKLCLEPPSADCPAEERYWFLGFISARGSFVPLGRVAWFGDPEPGTEVVDDQGHSCCALEEHDDTPDAIREFVHANLPNR